MKENFKCEGKNCVHEWPLKEEDHPYLCHKCGFDSETHKYNFPALDAWKESQTAKGEKPYIEERTDNIIRRTFSESVDEHELVWHRDKKDRVVKLLSETDWMIQFDNELPRKMSIDEAIAIPKNVYHRVIKGSGDLMVEITETDDVNEEEMIDEMKCWGGYHKEGTKISDKTGKRVNNCVKTKKKKKSVNEVVTSSEPKEDTILTKALNTISNFIRGKELTEFLNKLKTVQRFDDFVLKASKATEGANGFDIKIYDAENKKQVGVLAAIVYKSNKTGLYNLQIRKAGITPEYRGKGIMRTFYQQFNEWLKSNFDNFDKFTSDFIFLYDKKTGGYDGYDMWEDLVKKGLARRLGPDSNYVPPTTPKNGKFWELETGYALNEDSLGIKKSLKESIWDINPMIIIENKK